jgi:hypothetical protein
MLRECVKAFIDIMISSYNKEMAKKCAKLRENKKIVDKVLIVKDQYEDKNSIYIEGDTISSISYIDNNQSKENIIDINNSKIEEIDSKTNIITIKTSSNTKITIDIKNIQEIYDEIENKKLSYNKSQIVEDFIETVLSQSKTIKNEFINLSIEELYDKYGNAIIDRTWMCRSEHPYFAKNETQNYKKAKEIVKNEIIPQIKEKLTK